MITETNCLICGRNTEPGMPATVAPFLAQRIWNRDVFAAQYMHCTECDFGFFSPRLDPAEEAQLYAGYRDHRYVAERHATEPWYTETLNRSFDSLGTLHARCKQLRPIFARHFAAAPKRILDFGGDRGELIDAAFQNSEKYVYEISGIPPLAGVQSVSLTDAAGIPFDLILCSNVLEHVAYPRQVIAQMESLSRSGTFIFLEVPIESPHDTRAVAKRLGQAAVLMLTRPMLAMSLVKRRSIRIMHEHLNFYSLQALRELAASAATWQEITSGTYPPFHATASPTGWVLLQSRGKNVMSRVAYHRRSAVAGNSHPSPRHALQCRYLPVPPFRLQRS